MGLMKEWQKEYLTNLILRVGLVFLIIGCGIFGWWWSTNF